MPVIIHDADGLVARHTNIARLASLYGGEGLSAAKLGLSLLLLSGTSLPEIMDGQTAFKKGATPMAIEMESESGAVARPLLCDASIFLNALQTLRKLQNFAGLDTVTAGTKYTVTVKLWAEKEEEKKLYTIDTVRGTRYIFAEIAWRAYRYEDIGMDKRDFVSWCLGIQTSLAKLISPPIKVGKQTLRFDSEARVAPPRRWSDRARRRLRRELRKKAK